MLPAGGPVVDCISLLDYKQATLTSLDQWDHVHLRFDALHYHKDGNRGVEPDGAHKFWPRQAHLMIEKVARCVGVSIAQADMPEPDFKRSVSIRPNFSSSSSLLPMSGNHASLSRRVGFLPEHDLTLGACEAPTEGGGFSSG